MTTIAPPILKPSSKEILRAIPFALRFIYQADRKNTLLYLFVSVLMGPAVALGVFAVKGLPDALLAGDMGRVSLWAGLLVASVALRTIANTLQVICGDLLRFRLDYAVLEKNVDLASRLSYATLEDPAFRALADAYRRKSHVVMQVSQNLCWALFDVISLLGYLTVLAFLPWPVIVIFLATILLRFVMSRFEAEWSWGLFDHENREGRRAQYYASIFEHPRELFAARASDLHLSFRREWKRVTQSVLAHRIKNVTRGARSQAVMGFLEASGMAAALYFILRDISTGAAQIGSAVVFLASIQEIWALLGRILWNYSSITKEIPFLVVFKQFLSLPTEEEKGSKIPEGQLRVSFEDVWFRYPGTSEDILRGINLEFSEGEHIALVGLNGAGKTTLLKLLMGVYPPTRGRILVNGVDLTQVKPSAWRKALAILTQDSPRYDDVLREQVRYGDYVKLEDRERFDLALRVSGLAGIVEDMPKGLETHAGKQFAMPEDEAIELSGGQNQILAIARTLYREAHVYVFDEPTSAVDAEKEERFFEALPAALQSQAVLFVSHRFSTLRRAERIIVLDAGRVIEDGTHEELMLKKGRYAELFTLQAKMYQ